MAPTTHSWSRLQMIQPQTPNSFSLVHTTLARRSFNLDIPPCTRSSLVSRYAVTQVTSNESYREGHDISTVPKLELPKHDSTISIQVEYPKIYTRLVAVKACFPLRYFLRSVDLIIIVLVSLQGELLSMLMFTYTHVVTI